MFLESGADLHARTTSGGTPLHLALRWGAPDKFDDTIQSGALELVTLLLEFGSNRDTRARRLGLQHCDPQVRRLFSDHTSSECPVTFSHETGPLISLAEDLLNDKVFPPLRPFRSSREQQLCSSAWSPSRTKQVREGLLLDESSEAEALHHSNEPIDPYPKLIGRSSAHPLESAAIVSWDTMRASKVQLAIKGARSGTTTCKKDTRSQVGQGPSKKRKNRWQPLQFS